MKKILSFLSIALVIIAAGFSMSAKAANGSPSVNTFMKKHTGEYTWYEFKNVNEVKTALKNLSFTYTGEKNGGRQSNGDDGTVNTVKDCYKKGNTEIYVYKYKGYQGKMYILSVGIKFGTSAEKTTFMNQTKKAFNDTNGIMFEEGGLVMLRIMEN